jgi:single-strand DNA-binding protein
MNKVVLFGRLGRDPEARDVGDGGRVCSLSLATTERYKDKAGAWQEGTEWHRVVTFGRMAETCEQYLAKGREILVEGRLRTREWEDQAGAKRFSTEVVAANVTFAGGRGEAAGSAARPARNGRGSEILDLDDEIPF